MSLLKKALPRVNRRGPASVSDIGKGSSGYGDVASGALRSHIAPIRYLTQFSQRAAAYWTFSMSCF